MRLLEPAAGDDERLVERLTGLVNDVYAAAESGLWREGTTRTTAAELAELIRAGEIAVATRNGQVVGSVRIHDVAEDTGEFGLLAAAPDQRGTGVGSALVAFAEQHGRERGLRAMQLELLVPREWRHPSKEFLKAWYGRIGYRIIRTANVIDSPPGPRAAAGDPVRRRRVREIPLARYGSHPFGLQGACPFGGTWRGRVDAPSGPGYPVSGSFATAVLRRCRPSSRGLRNVRNCGNWGGTW